MYSIQKSARFTVKQKDYLTLEQCLEKKNSPYVQSFTFDSSSRDITFDFEMYIYTYATNAREEMSKAFIQTSKK